MRRSQSHTSCDNGAAAIEYAFLAAFIAAVIAATVGLLGVEVVGLYNSVVGTF